MACLSSGALASAGGFGLVLEWGLALIRFSFGPMAPIVGSSI